MKKIYSLFILSILALTMFVGCQMPTDGTDSRLEADKDYILKTMSIKKEKGEDVTELDKKGLVGFLIG